MDPPEQPKNLNTILLRKLSTAVNGHAVIATFACGGSVPVVDENLLEPGKLAASPPAKLRWDTDLQAKASITLPPPQPEEAAFSAGIRALLQTCDPATFGVGGQDVLDEQYRKASKLDKSQFSTNFHPHDCGILDSVQQILLPSTIKGGLGIDVGPQSFKAELYKLNIYSAPSGKFRAHVDTPRGPTQFGSLVVCLPCQHEGGILRIKHRGQTADFDWANADPRSIHWAAFYGDCEHEVLEVTSGHRVTLTYNLFYSGTNDLNHGVHIPYQLPLYPIVRDMLQEPTFMQKGGLLGFFCHHQYAHAHDSGRKSLPHAFKGVDLAVYSVFRSLGLKVGLHPVIENPEGGMGGMSSKKLMEDKYDASQGDHVDLFFKKSHGRFEEFVQKHGIDINDRQYEKDEEWEAEERYRDMTSLVGTQLHGPKFDPVEKEGASDKSVTDAWPHQRIPKIIWMNEPTQQDFAFAGLAYGNQAELNYRFSAATLIVTIPPSTERLSPSTASKPPAGAYSDHAISASMEPRGDNASF
ncbi:MAG: hypothetical protein Q9170_005571 [Blastenia crenularia]